MISGNNPPKKLQIRLYIQTCLRNLPFMLIFLCLTSYAQTSPPDTTQTICVGKLRGTRYRLIDEAKGMTRCWRPDSFTLCPLCVTQRDIIISVDCRLHRTGWNTEFKVGAQNADGNSLCPSCSSFETWTTDLSIRVKKDMDFLLIFGVFMDFHFERSNSFHPPPPS